MRDIKSWVISLFIIVSIILTSMAIMASAEGKTKNSARAAALYSPDTEVFLYEKNADARLPMASTTKIMTALVVLENTSLDNVVHVHPDAIGVEGSSIYLKLGDSLTVRDLLYSLLLRSANDAAAALAYEVGGSIEDFSALMNLRADSLGLKNTNFTNPHGLDSENHYTTARELALITAEALKNESFRNIVSTYKYSFTLGDSPRTVVNHNKLLKSYEGAIGVKTGYTKKCGRCLVGAAQRDGITLVTVTLDAPDDWRDHKELFDYGFNSLETTYIRELCDTEFKIPVIGGKSEYVTASLKDNSVIISGKNDVFTSVLDIKRFAPAPIKQGETLGSIIIYKNGVYYGIYEVVSTENVEKIKEKRFFDFLK